MTIERRIEELLIEGGAATVGFATTETLSGGPPSTDLDYVLPGARSAVSFSLAMNPENIRPFLAKETGLPSQAQLELYPVVDALSEKVAGLLIESGYEATVIAANLERREDSDSKWYEPFPPLSHRYIAVASGAASFGWSGNVGVAGHGSNVFLGTCVTTAELVPTEPIPEGEGFCESCKICVAACPVEMFDKEEPETVSLGGKTYMYAKRRDIVRCLMCCSGITGLHKSGEWGSWSPGRFTLPDGKREMREALERAAKLAKRRPDPPMIPGHFDFGEEHPLSGMPAMGTCGVCQLVCYGDKKERARHLKTLRNSGVVVQWPDGSWEVMPPRDAAEILAEMDPAHRDLYE